eukprot:gnl/Hemi2/24648_TR8291_c0_g2_i1.p1 gnl/Hemi2/24648_TR8291_c0_g2~~gnl/Hemi2/24648_TR8291_c0_g2_i1.p1  ORF type:complete len:519 (+),score=190.69 gnl/Hemi2/24648_TR8291_c0_g2_i1:115-1671(+)
MDQWVIWLVFSLLILGILAFAFFVIRYYNDPHERQNVVTVVIVLTLANALLCVLVVPCDISTISSTMDSSKGLRIMSQSEIDASVDNIKVLYYVLFVSLVLLTFFVLPFCYFYYEEDDDLPVSKRSLQALKFTSIFIAIIIVMFVIGLIVTPRGANGSWWGHVTDNSTVVSALIFTVSILTAFGLLGWISYTAYGMSALPVEFLKPKKSLEALSVDLSSSISICREKTRAIESKYSLSERKMSHKDKQELEKLKKQERMLSSQTARLQQSSGGMLQRLVVMMAPLRILFGTVFFLLTLLLLASMVITSIDKIVNSSMNDGYVLRLGPQLFNPFDQMMIALSSAFPIDLIALASVVIFIFFSSLTGIFRLGIRILWIALWRIRPRGTSPQALILLAILMTHIILALCSALLTFMPQYATFGSQTFQDLTNHNAVTPCMLETFVVVGNLSVANGAGNCTSSRLSAVYNAATLGHSFFALVLFYGNWLFIAAFVFWLLYSMLKRDSHYSALNDATEEEEFV